MRFCNTFHLGLRWIPANIREIIRIHLMFLAILLKHSIANRNNVVRFRHLVHHIKAIHCHDNRPPSEA